MGRIKECLQSLRERVGGVSSPESSSLLAELTPNETRLLRPFVRQTAFTRTHLSAFAVVPHEEVNQLIQSLQEKDILSPHTEPGPRPVEVFIPTRRGRQVLRRLYEGR